MPEYIIYVVKISSDEENFNKENSKKNSDEENHSKE